MSTSIQEERKVKPIPDGMHSITPHLVCDGAVKAIEFYKKAFNATGESILFGKDGKVMHAQVIIGDSPVMLVDEFPDWGMLGPKALGGSAVAIHLYVENVDNVFRQAVDAGAEVIAPLEIPSGVTATESSGTPSAISGHWRPISKTSVRRKCDPDWKTADSRRNTRGRGRVCCGNPQAHPRP